MKLVVQLMSFLSHFINDEGIKSTLHSHIESGEGRPGQEQ